VKYLLDANVVIALFKNKPAVVRALRFHNLKELAVSSIVMHELYFGAYKSNSRRSFTDLETLRLAVLPFDSEDAARAGEVRAMLDMRGTPIGPYDVLIAGQALARGLILITRNVREFSRIPDLRIENWEPD
jgi:tRNA(fMet)-specific endonuclease VapC